MAWSPIWGGLLWSNQHIRPSILCASWQLFNYATRNHYLAHVMRQDHWLVLQRYLSSPCAHFRSCYGCEWWFCPFQQLQRPVESMTV